MHWLLVLFGIVLGTPIAYFLLGLATAAQSADLHSELWQYKIALERLAQAVEGDTRTLDNHALNTALNEAREVLGR